VATYMLTWNPETWQWDNLDREAAATVGGEPVERRWSTGNTKRVVPGDRVFLLKQGDPPRGIIASGTAVSEVTEDRHYVEERALKGDRSNYVKVKFDLILNPRTRDPWSPSDEADSTLAGVRWDAPASGFEIPADAATMIDAAWRTHVAIPARGRFQKGVSYTREEIQLLLRDVPERGGDWHTGYHQHKATGEWFLFPTVGAAGRTGHNYGNAWEGRRLRWIGRTGANINHTRIKSLLRADARVHLFTREDSRAPFTYEGLVRPVETISVVPVQIVWERVGDSTSSPLEILPDEVSSVQTYREGAVRTVVVDAYERSPAARLACIKHHGTNCSVCGLDMERRYGPIAAGFIHVHHLRALADIGDSYEVDAVKDLRPVCPNCHAVIHLRRPSLSIEEATALLKRR
jgi:5-methylcytosine-specific restriction enzyme A